MRYAGSVLGDLIACPFCREMFTADEAGKCPTCGLELAPVSKLPASYEVGMEDAAPVDPDQETLPWWTWRRGRGALVLLGVAGAICFFVPWVHVRTPEIATLSGFDIARVLGWVWGCLVAWLTLIPTALSRRSIGKMRGARLAAAFFAAVPLVTTAVLMLRPPRGTTLVPVRFEYEAGIYATMALAVGGLVVALRFGGRSRAGLPRQSSADAELLH
jgi:magnesium-transporting ATPase (P-type)